MPTYQYVCTECGDALEVQQSFSEDSLTVCPNCEGRLRKIFNAVGVVFKGSGFYHTDSREAAAAGTSQNGTGSEASGSQSSAESSGGGSEPSGGSSDSGSGDSSSSGGSSGSSGSGTAPSNSSSSGSNGSSKSPARS